MVEMLPAAMVQHSHRLYMNASNSSGSIMASEALDAAAHCKFSAL
jgi:hypothetical protein